MNAIRVVMITRRFWPLAQGDELLAAELGQQLARLGAALEIVTARFDSRWPARVCCRELVVHRLPFPRSPFGWGAMRYMIALSRWLRRNRPDVDAVLVFGMSLDAYAALGALRSSEVPVVIRLQMEDVDESLASPLSRRIAHIHRRCQDAAAIVATTHTAADQLKRVGFAPQCVHWIPDGVRADAAANASQRLAARAALAHVNEDLRVGMNSPVVACLAPLEPAYQLESLIEAWSLVAQRSPHARLWLVGDGSQRERLYQLIQDLDLLGRVLLPGTFDETDEVLLASDLLVVPGTVDQPRTVLRAMAARVPVLVAQRDEHDNLVDHGQRGRLFAAGAAEPLAAALEAALADPSGGQSRAEQAYAFVQRHHRLEAMSQQYYELLQSVIRSSPGRSVP